MCLIVTEQCDVHENVIVRNVRQWNDYVNEPSLLQLNLGNKSQLKMIL